MRFPKIVLHFEMSLDGRLDHLDPDLEQYYRSAASFQEDATLVGCDTLLAAAEEIPPETRSDLDPPLVDPDDQRPLLIVPDSRGRLKSWYYWRRAGYWRDVIALCSHATPDAYIDYLAKRHITTVVAGDDQVDLKPALEQVAAVYDLHTLRVDSGGTLSGVLLRQGLVSEVSVLIEPRLVGGMTPRSIFNAPDLQSSTGVVSLELIQLEQRDDGVVWVRYRVLKQVD